MEITVIYPPAPEETIPDRENDRLSQDLIERGDKGEFDRNNTELATDEVLEEMAAQWDTQWNVMDRLWSESFRTGKLYEA